MTQETEIGAAIFKHALTGKEMKGKAKVGDGFSSSVEEQTHLYEKMMQGNATGHELVKLSFLREMISEEQYTNYLQIEKDCEEDYEV